MNWVASTDHDEPPIDRWECAVCDAPYGEPHQDGCKCTLYCGVSDLDADVIDDALKGEK